MSVGKFKGDVQGKFFYMVSAQNALLVEVVKADVIVAFKRLLDRRKYMQGIAG